MVSAKIGKKALKIACLQVLPGHEFEVAENLKQKVVENKFNPISIFKGFGSWDLILVYEQPDFEPYLSTTGPIHGILGTKTFLCFQYRKIVEGDSIVDCFGSYKFFGFVFMKLELNNKLNIEQIEDILFQDLDKSIKSNWFAFGSLGWNEFIVVTSAVDLSQITTELYALNCEFELKKEQSTLKKTSSHLAIRHDFLAPLYSIEPTIESFESNLDNLLGTCKIPDNLDLVVYFASKTQYYSNLIDYWRNSTKDFDLSACYGEFDLKVRLKRHMKWSKFLALLLFCRQLFKSEICSTRTIISYTPTFKGTPTPIPELRPTNTLQSEITLPYNISHAELENALGKRMAHLLTTQFYRLNSLMQNPLISDCFKILSKFPDTVIVNAKEMEKQEDTKSKIEYMAYQSALVLNRAIELRLHGTSGDVQNSYSYFGNLNSGIQRSLSAMEFLTNYLISSLGMEWHGFIISRDPKFAHIQQEIICVPTDAFWKPNTWWALYHEIAHVIIDKAKWVDARINSVNSFLEKRMDSYRDASIELLNEIAAEIIGYEIGFFGDFKLYLRFVWEHLFAIERKQHKAMALWTYIVRTFCVELYDRLYSENNNSRIDESAFSDKDFMFENFLKHIKSVEEIINKLNIPSEKIEKLLERAPSTAAANAPQFMDLLPFFKDIYNLNEKGKTTVGRGFRPDLEQLNNPQTTRAVSAIIDNNEVFWEEIKFPEALIYKFFSNAKNSELSNSIALILSLWNTSMIQNKRS